MALLGPLVLAACAAHDENVASRVDSAGIEIVTSTAEDLPAPWKLTKVGAFGGEMSDTMLITPAGYLMLDAGSQYFYILDRDAKRIVMLDTTAHLAGAFGREGDGPGELRFAAAMSVAPERELTVLDVGRGRLLSFTLAGDTLGDKPIPPAHTATFALGHFGDELVMEKRHRDSAGTVLDLMIVGHGDSGILAKYRSPESRNVTSEVCGVSMLLPPLFSPRLHWSSAGDWLAVSSTAEYDVGVYHVGAAPRRVRRSIPQRSSSEALAREELGEGAAMRVGDRPCVRPAAEGIAQRGMSERIPAIRRMLIDADGWLRVQRYTIKGEPELLDIFNPGGEYVGTMTGEHSMPDAAAGNYIATAVDDSLGLPTIVVSRIDGRGN